MFPLYGAGMHGGHFSGISLERDKRRVLSGSILPHQIFRESLHQRKIPHEIAQQIQHVDTLIQQDSSPGDTDIVPPFLPPKITRFSIYAPGRYHFSQES